MHKELLVRKYCTRRSSAVLSTADELVAPLCSRLPSQDCTLPSGSDRTRVHVSKSGAASERGGRAAAKWRQESRAKEQWHV
eukprot:1079113-Pleurochrysis_carterae.AAC.1